MCPFIFEIWAEAGLSLSSCVSLWRLEAFLESCLQMNSLMIFEKRTHVEHEQIFGWSSKLDPGLYSL